MFYWTRQNFGGVINDFASHQMDQLLYFTGSTTAEVVAANVGNFKHAQFSLIHDFDDVMVRSPHANGYVHVDWLTLKGLDSWGDGCLFVLGTEGYVELRNNTDLAGREGANHLFLIDLQGMRYVDYAGVQPLSGKQFVEDLINRIETAMSQAHCFFASEFALRVELMASDLTKRCG